MVQGTKLVLAYVIVVSGPTTAQQHYCDMIVMSIITVNSLQSYSVNKFCYLKMNAQILNGPIAVLEKDV